MADLYKIDNKKLQNIWAVISKDVYIRQNNLNIIKDICKKNNIDYDISCVFSGPDISWDSLYDTAVTPSFFGERLIVIKDISLTQLKDDEIEKLCEILDFSQGNYFALICDFEDERKLTAKRFSSLIDKVELNGEYLLVAKITEKYLEDIALECAQNNNTIIQKSLVKTIVQNMPEDVSMLINEMEKLCAACGYTEITQDIIDVLCYKTTDATVFEIIDFVCRSRGVQAIKKLNNLFDMRVDEIMILGSITSAFVDMHRCKIASLKGIGFNEVNKDFEKTAKPYRYQKAMANSNNFSLQNLEEILSIILDMDIAFKSTNLDKKQSLSVLIAQIIAKGNT